MSHCTLHSRFWRLIVWSFHACMAHPDDASMHATYAHTCVLLPAHHSAHDLLCELSHRRQ